MARTFRVLFRTELFVTDEVTYFVEEHTLGQPARTIAHICTDEPFDLVDLLGARAELQMGFDGEGVRSCFGIIESAEMVGRGGANTGESAIGYRLTIVSSVQLLAGSFGNRIFQDMNVQDIVTQVLTDHGVDPGDLDWKVTGSYPQREYCVQYQESALHFVSRLLEEEGIYFYAEPKEEGESIVFCDDSTVADSIEGTETLPLAARADLEPGEDAVFTCEHQHRVCSGKFVLRDFDFKRPSLDLTADAASDVFTDLEVYDYPGLYFDPSEGSRLAQVRLEEEQASRATLSLTSSCLRLRVGRVFAVSTPDGDERLFITHLRHSCTVVPDETRGEPKPRYQLEIEAIPVAVPFRPPRQHARPIVEGPQTATVVAPEGSPPEEIHPDEHGRVKVAFHWDTSGIGDDHASCWMRVGQLQTSGSLALPRVNWEVIIEFLEGNPDRPVVSGRLYNGIFMPPYALPDGATRTSLQTSSSPGGGGTNEIRFEDKAGSEEIMVHSQYNTTVNAANNRDRTIGVNDTLTVGSNATYDIGANQEIKIANGHKCSIGGSQSVTVGGNRSQEVNAVSGLTVGGDASTTVGAMHFEMNGSPLAGLIATVSAAAAAAAQAKAAEAIGKVQGAVQGKIDQTLGPINDLANQAGQMDSAMSAMANGDLAASAALTTAAAGLPNASAVMGAIGGGPAAAQGAGGADPTGVIAATNAINSMVANAAGGLTAKANAAIGDAFGTSGGGGGGSSAANVGGPDGAVGGVSESDTATGPGHAQYKITGNHTETTSALRVALCAGGMNLNVSGSMTQSVGAALVELMAKDHAESAEGAKTETQAGLVVLSKGGESETASAAMNTLVGGAILEKIDGDYSVQAAGAATFIGAFHKVDAKGKITFKCGASTVVVDGSGIAITSPLITVTGASLQITKSVNDV